MGKPPIVHDNTLRLHKYTWGWAREGKKKKKRKSTKEKEAKHLVERAQLALQRAISRGSGERTERVIIYIPFREHEIIIKNHDTHKGKSHLKCESREAKKCKIRPAKPEDIGGI